MGAALGASEGLRGGRKEGRKPCICQLQLLGPRSLEGGPCLLLLLLLPGHLPFSWASQPPARPPASSSMWAPRRRPRGSSWPGPGPLLLAAWGSVVCVLAGLPRSVAACPAPCACSGPTVDCHGLGLRAVPKNLPRGAERLELNGNNITRINKNDFAGLKQLRVLQLMENQISVVERGVFDDMKELERLRLNRNQLHTLPELLFQNNQALSRLDLSENFLQAIPRKAFRGATDLKNLQLDKNHISCIEEGAFRALRSLEVLTLNNNNISTIPISSFNHMPKLRTL